MHTRPLQTPCVFVQHDARAELLFFTQKSWLLKLRLAVREDKKLKKKSRIKETVWVKHVEMLIQEHVPFVKKFILRAQSKPVRKQHD